MTNPIESAADLHREISKRGLELRPEVGRDAALVAELASKLGIPSIRFISELEASGKTAEDYLRALMLVAVPFAQMFREIWAYLARHCAPKAKESLVVRFGFNGDNKDFDWDAFRVMVETAGKVLSFGPTLLWRDQHLFDLGRILFKNIKHQRTRYYKLGESIQLEPINVISSTDEVGSKARAVIQSLIDAIHLEWPRLEERERMAQEWQGKPGGKRQLPELQLIPEDEANNSSDRGERQRSTRELAYLLTDLIPSWTEICAQWDLIPASDKYAAEEFFHSQIEPFLESTQAPVWRRVQEALDLLDLPFWRYRWHTYEVWASVKALEALAEFCPQPVVKDGHLALDAANPALIARLSAKQPIYAHVQGETKLAKPFGTRKAIKPDLRFSLDDPASNEATLAIVEYKQRRELDAKHASEVLEAYSMGAGLGGGVVLVNYDAIPKIAIPPLCTLLGDVRPGQPSKVREYQTAVRDCFKRAGFVPRAIKRFVLLDVSSSMNSEYASQGAQRGLKRLVTLPWIKVFRFNDGLVDGGDLKTDSSIATSGGTQLGAALEQLFSLPDAGVPERLIIVTDGGHDHPNELLEKCGEYRECRPEDLEAQLDWLTQE